MVQIYENAAVLDLRIGTWRPFSTAVTTGRAAEAEEVVQLGDSVLWLFHGRCIRTPSAPLIHPHHLVDLQYSHCQLEKHKLLTIVTGMIAHIDANTLQ